MTKPMTKQGLLQLHYAMRKHRLLIFTILLLAFLLIFPFVHQQYMAYLVVMEAFFSMLLIGGIYVVSHNERLLTVAILMALLIFSIIWFNLFLQSQDLLIFGLIAEVVFFIMTTAIIVSHVLEYKRVTADKIYGAISGYLLMGIVWALLYTTVEYVHPGAFKFGLNGHDVYRSPYAHPYYFVHFIYYSFVTLTTLGYGDILPINPVARALASLEAVFGQLYVAVLIARLVGLHIGHARLSDLE